MTRPSLSPRFAAALGPGAIEHHDDAVTIQCAGREEAVLAVELCRDTRTRFEPGGSGRHDHVALRLAAADPLLDLWPEDLVGRVNAGATFAELDERLEPFGLWLPNETPRPDATTIGASFATAESGWGLRPSGAVRERALGVLAVDGNARLLKGGARVVKNVAGFDLTRLHYGAQGAFGMTLDFLFRLEARPEAVRWRALGCRLAELESRLQVARRPNSPTEGHVQLWLDPHASRALDGPREGAIVMALEGRSDVVARWEQSFGEGELNPERVRDFGYTDTKSPWRISLAPRRLLESWPSWRALLDDAGIAARLVVDLAGGNHRLAIDGDSPQELRRFERRVRGAGAKLRIPRDQRVEDEPHSVARRLKLAFDPHGLLPAVPA